MKRQCDLCLKHFAPENQFNVCADCAELIAAQNAAPYSAIKITL